MSNPGNRNTSSEDRTEDEVPMSLSSPRLDGYGLLAGPSDESHFTIRAVLCGLLIGTIMCFSNMYFGLQTGWISMMSLQSSLLGYAMFKPFKGKLRRAFGPIENVVLQTTAVATATMPLAAGFVGIIPALQSMTEEDHPGGGLTFSSGQLIVWSLGVAFFGVFFAIPLRTQTIIREKLRFPSGTATAQMISILHQREDPTERKQTIRLVNGNQLRHRNNQSNEGRPLLSEPSVPNRSYSPPVQSPTPPPTESQEETDEEFEAKWVLKWRALLVSFSVSSLYTVTTYFFPIAYALPIFNWLSLGFIDFKAWDWYFTPSLSYVGQGIIMGLPTTLSMLLGCVIGWGILSPLAHHAGWAPGPVDDWKDGSKGWILWISLGVMISESFVSLSIVSIRSIVKAVRPNRSFNGMPAAQETSARAAEEEIVAELDESAGLQSSEEEEEDDAPPDQLVSPIVTVMGLLISTALCLVSVAYVFGTDLLPLHITFIAVLLAMILSVLGVSFATFITACPNYHLQLSDNIFALSILTMSPANLSQDSLYRLCSNLSSSNRTVHKIAGETRRACVAIIIRWRRGQYDRTPIDSKYRPRNWMDFMHDKMVQRDGGYPELLFIRRAKRAGDPWSGDMAFPGGRNEEGENDLDTVVREVQEEVGLDLNSNDFVKLGCLDDREITSLLGGKPFMILSTFVYLQVSSESPQITRQNSEVAGTHWIPLHHFLYSRIKTAKPVKLPVLPLKSKLPSFFGTVALPSMLVPVKEETIVLWGLALTMTSELVSYTQTTKEIARHGQVAPLVRMIKAYPKLSQWDLNGFVRLFCFANSTWRVLKGEKQNAQTNISTSWAGGPSIPDYFASVRRALYVATAVRATAGLATGGYLAHKIIKSAYGNR